MAKRIYCFVMDDSIREEVELGNYAMAAVYLSDAASEEITDQEMDAILKCGEDADASVDAFVEKTDVIIKAINKYRDMY